MSIEVWGMTAAGVAALVAGLALVRRRLGAIPSGAARVIELGPVFEAVALAMFAAEHFTAARDLMPIVPRWLPGPLFWTYFFGAALLAAAVSLVLRRQVHLSAALLALFFVLIVATLDLPNVGRAHDRFFWILTVRETCFAGGAMVLAGSVWLKRASSAGRALMRAGRWIVAGTMIFYAIEHFLFPKFVPGVPLEKPMPGWVPAPVVLSDLIGITLLVGGIGLFLRRKIRIAAAGAGSVLVLLTVLFYVPIFLMEMRTRLAVEGLNYIGDTLLFAATVLLAGFDAEIADASGMRTGSHSAPVRERTRQRVSS